MPKHDKAFDKGASVCFHGGSDKGLVVQVAERGRNVLAVSGQAGTGKSDILAMLARRDRLVFAEKHSFREPTETERAGSIPYAKSSLEEILKRDEPCLCSTNVDFSLEAQERWIRWWEILRLYRLGIVVPETELAVSLVEEFSNVYMLKTVTEQQCQAASEGKVLLLEICPELEKIWAQLFPEMKVVRLFVSRGERARRLLNRYQPLTEREWAIASIKILNSVSTDDSYQRYSPVCHLVSNETRLDAAKNKKLVERLLKPERSSAKEPAHVNLSLALGL